MSSWICIHKEEYEGLPGFIEMLESVFHNMSYSFQMECVSYCMPSSHILDAGAFTLFHNVRISFIAIMRMYEIKHCWGLLNFLKTSDTARIMSTGSGLITVLMTSDIMLKITTQHERLFGHSRLEFTCVRNRKLLQTC